MERWAEAGWTGPGQFLATRMQSREAWRQPWEVRGGSGGQRRSPCRSGSAMTPGLGSNHWPASASRPEAVRGQPGGGRTEVARAGCLLALVFNALPGEGAVPRTAKSQAALARQEESRRGFASPGNGGMTRGGGWVVPALWPPGWGWSTTPCQVHEDLLPTQRWGRDAPECSRKVRGCGRKHHLWGPRLGELGMHPRLTAPGQSCPLVGVWGERQKSQLQNKW